MQTAAHNRIAKSRARTVAMSGALIVDQLARAEDFWANFERVSLEIPANGS